MSGLKGFLITAGVVLLALVVIGVLMGSPAEEPSASPSPAPSAEPSSAPSPTPAAGCPTGELGTPSETLPPNADVWSQGEGDRCAWLSLYFAWVDLVPEPDDPDTLTERRTLERRPAIDDFALVAVFGPTGAPLPAEPASKALDADGALRFYPTPGYVWRLVYRGAPVFVSEGCEISELNLDLPEDGRERYVLRLRAPREPNTRQVSVCDDVRATDGVAVGELSTFDVGADEPLATPPPLPQLNPILLALRASQWRYHQPALIEQVTASAATYDAVGLATFVVSGGVTLLLGCFAFWLLFLSGDRPAKAKRRGAGEPTPFARLIKSLRALMARTRKRDGPA